ncbi:MAG: hypothetical protein ACQERX_00785 [Bacillota bacterium]
MKSRLAVIPIVLYFAFVTVLELLNATNKLNITNAFLIVGFIFIVIFFILINIYSYNRSILNNIIIGISFLGYAFILFNMTIFELFDNNEIFIYLNQILFLSFLPFSNKLKRVLEEKIRT